jgi:hypothetical protein
MKMGQPHFLFLIGGWNDAFHFTRFLAVVSPLYLDIDSLKESDYTHNMTVHTVVF